jgi:hypothetical protein
MDIGKHVVGYLACVFRRVAGRLSLSVETGEGYLRVSSVFEGDLGSVISLSSLRNQR